MDEYDLSHIVLTSHPGKIFKDTIPIHWGAKTLQERGPIVATLTNEAQRNAIGTHSGSYAVYRALATAAGDMPRDHKPDLTNTHPVADIKPNPSWFDPEKIVALDPWGANVHQDAKEWLDQGYDIRPTIAVTQAHIQMPEIDQAIEAGRLKVDGKLVKKNGDNYDVFVTKAAIEPVWYLPGLAKRLGVDEGHLRKVLYIETGGMFPELITRPDLKVLLPPIGSITVYIMGNVDEIADPDKELTMRVHDECNGSDVFGSDICTCRPYLIHGIEEAVHTAQNGGTGMIVYFRKEGRALGEVTKFLVYNARKRQVGGDQASQYFHRTECVAGVQDMRFQELMPDTLHWLGVQKIDNLISMSNMKYDAIVNSGIEVVNRVSIPEDRIPQDAMVEIQAKKAAGYFSESDVLDKEGLDKLVGRKLDE